MRLKLAFALAVVGLAFVPAAQAAPMNSKIQVAYDTCATREHNGALCESVVFIEPPAAANPDGQLQQVIRCKAVQDLSSNGGGGSSQIDCKTMSLGWAGRYQFVVAQRTTSSAAAVATYWHMIPDGSTKTRVRYCRVRDPDWKEAPEPSCTDWFPLP